jgi:hypothetical protein
LFIYRTGLTDALSVAAVHTPISATFPEFSTAGLPCRNKTNLVHIEQAVNVAVVPRFPTVNEPNACRGTTSVLPPLSKVVMRFLPIEAESKPMDMEEYARVRSHAKWKYRLKRANARPREKVTEFFEGERWSFFDVNL